MNFNKIDISSWPRGKLYKHYMTDVPCTYSMSVNLDISVFLLTLKSQKLKLFPTMLYAISRLVNRHKEFRMCYNENKELGYYDVLNPCYAVFHQDIDEFSNLWTQYSENFETFYSNYHEDMKQYGDEYGENAKPLQGDNLFNVSCIPWVSFTGFNLNLQKGYDYLAPIFTIGKYYKDADKVLLPLALQVHHAVCDGFHVARFVNELQEWMDGFSL